MLSYQHSYHAGNLADVHKHSLLLACLRACVKASSVLVYGESHAGRGLYDLWHENAQKTGEWQRGIGRLVKTHNLEGPLNHYRKAVLNFSRAKSADQLHYYPGSPAIARMLMRRQDQAVLHDLHPQEFGALNHGLRGDQRFSIAKKDGLTSMLETSYGDDALTFALIDPSYENKGEFEALSDWLNQAFAAHIWDVILVWYPRLSDQRHVCLEKAHSLIGTVSTFDFAVIDPQAQAGAKMFGSGIGLTLARHAATNKSLAKTLRRQLQIVSKDLAAWHARNP